MFEKYVLYFLAIFFLIVLPIISTFKYWNYKPFMKYVLSLMWICYIALAYEVLYPRDVYYKNLLHKSSNIIIGDELKIIDKYTSLMNIKAQYYSCAVFEVSHDVSDLKILKSEDSIKLPSLNTRCDNIISSNFDRGRLVTYKTSDNKSTTYWGYQPNQNKMYVIYNFYAMAYKE